MESKQWQSSTWWSALHEQATPETIAAGVQVAEVELARLARYGVAVLHSGEDVVNAAMLAITDGTCMWEPAAYSLRTHLCHKVRQAVRGLRERRRVPPALVALDAVDDDDPVWTDQALASDGVRDAELRDLARQVERDVWRGCAADPVALRVLEAMSGGARGEQEIASLLEVPRTVVLNALRRINRVALGLPARLVQDVRSLLRAEASTDGTP